MGAQAIANKKVKQLKPLGVGLSGLRLCFQIAVVDKLYRTIGDGAAHALAMISGMIKTPLKQLICRRCWKQDKAVVSVYSRCQEPCQWYHMHLRSMPI